VKKTNGPELTSREATDAVLRRFAGAPHTACVMTFGCQQNEADSERLRGMAREMGYTMVDDPAEADLAVFNTCAVREHAEQKVLSRIGQLKAQKALNPDMVIGVCGCMTAQAHRIDALRAHYPYVSFTLDPASLDRFPQAVEQALRHNRTFLTGGDTPEIVEGIPVQRSEKHRAWVSVMYGCNNFCSYCIVPYVRGRERSRASSDIVREVEELIADGCREITLLGQNVNSYHSDCDFAALLDRLAAIPGDYILRFMTSHPKDVPDDLIAVMARHPDHIAPHFHLPVQSGSDAVLARMNRRYTRETYQETVRKLREAIPGIVLTTDVIVGFPGETEADFCETLDLLRTVRYDLVYSFLYSPRRGTPAAAMGGAVSEAERKDRMARLLAEQEALSAAASQAYLGKTVRVLVDGPSKTGDLFSGRTPGNKLVHFAPEGAGVGDFVWVRITRTEPFALYGTIVTP